MLTPSTDTSNRARSAEAMPPTDGVSTGRTITCSGSTPERLKGLRFFGVLPAGAACPAWICGMRLTGGTTERNTPIENNLKQNPLTFFDACNSLVTARRLTPRRRGNGRRCAAKLWAIHHMPSPPLLPVSTPSEVRQVCPD